uniref:Cytochrome P450 n=1 Tax=Oryza punctata TaxID=4537 RepID=A0A0E0LLD2_ORYPU
MECYLFFGFHLYGLHAADCIPHTISMDSSILLALLLALFIPIFLHLLTRFKNSSYNLPPGSLGFPFIGQSISFLRALRSNTDYQWFQGRIRKYGPVSKMWLFGSPAVLMAGPAANHFIFSNKDLLFTGTRSINVLTGRNILMLSGEELKQVRGALQNFLSPEMLIKCVSKIDEEVRRHVKVNWVGHKTVKVLPLAKRLTFDIICSVIFGQEAGSVREVLATDFQTMVKAALSIPVKIPFTRFSRGLSASQRIRKLLRGIARERETLLQQGHGASADDFFTYMLALRAGCAHSLTVEDIVDNAIFLLIAGYETTSVLITFMLWHLDKEPEVLGKITEEQDEIARNKGPEDALTWNDVSRMKYTWKVFTAQSVTHLDANIFPEPSNFDPARFENNSSIPPYCFVPFGGGPRMCPGNEFARTETLVTMHYLVTQFRWKMCCKEESYKKDPSPTPLLGLPIELEPRCLPENAHA